jgi:nucleotide-binding universal stress UspA family protein
MATVEAIAKMEDQAFASMLHSMTRLAAAVDVAPVDVQAIYFSDPAYQRAQQLLALADWLHQVTDAVAGPEQPADGEPAADLPFLETLTVKELRAYAEEHGIELGDASKKADLIAAIETALVDGSPAGSSE